MYRRSALVLSLFALAACTNETPTTPALTPPDALLNVSSGLESIDGSYLVRFKEGIPSDFGSRVAAAGGEVMFTHAGAGVGAVRGLSATAANDLAVKTGVEVTPDDAVAIDAMSGEIEGFANEATTADPASPTNPALAAIYIRQWGMRAIEANKAWAAGKLGESSTKVGILDTGLDYLSADLFGRVDLNLSRSYLSAAENARVQAAFPGAHPVADGHYHGTHVGATVVSNGLVAAGVTSRVTLVGLKVCSPGTAQTGFRGTCPTSGTLQAILDAADWGLPVINMSLGGSFLRRAASARGGDSPSFMAIINSVFQYANEKNTVIVVSAGNDAADMQHAGNRYYSYCDAPHVVCVSATGPTAAPVFGVYENVDAPAPYSNYGNKIDVAAPGGTGTNSTTTPHRGWVYAVCSGFTLVPSLAPCRTRFYNPASGAWSSFVLGVNGTSMAAPHASGVAALIAGRIGNNSTAVRDALGATSDDRGAVGKDTFYGNGRVNAFRASQ